MSLIDALRCLKRKLFPPIDPFPVDAWTDANYQKWFEQHKASSEELGAQRATTLANGPKFSVVVPLYETPLGFLEDAVKSVLEQTYGNLELILVNASPENESLARKVAQCSDQDQRVVVVSLSENQGIAENTREGIAAATGDFICFLDHDDFLEPNALYEYAKILEQHSETDLIYSDEDLVEECDQGRFVHKHPFFKPAYSSEALLCTNYILHFLAIRASVLNSFSYADRSVDGTQDYHTILSVARLTDRMRHVPKVLYHWRMSARSTAANPDAKPYDRIAARRSIGAYASSEYPDAQIVGSGIVNTQNLWFRPSKEKPVVSVVVDASASDSPQAFLELFSQTNSYHHVEIILVLGHGAPLFEARDGVKIVQADPDSSRFGRFNAGAHEASGEHLLFMDAHAFFQTPEPLEQMLGFCRREGIGVVAPKTLYADGSVKCYGVAVTPERIMPLYRGYPDDFPGYQCNTRSFQNNSAASYLGLMTPRALFHELGGFDERFNGEVGAADYCRRVMNEGKRIVLTCTVKLQSDERCPKLHYDNATNAPDFTPEDLTLFDEKWPGVRAAGDPYFNENLDQSSSYFQIPHQPKER